MIRTVAGPAFLAIVSLALLAFSRTDIPTEWEPVREAIDLSRPNTVRATFTGRPDADYRLGVEVDPAPVADCLLDVRPDRSEPACTEEGRLDVAWRVRAGGRVLTSGSTDDWPGSSWGGGGGLAASLDGFGPLPGEVEYDVELTIRAASPGLAELSPRLVVSIGGGERHADMFSRVAAFYAGAAGLIAALVDALVVLWRRRPRMQG